MNDMSFIAITLGLVLITISFWYTFLNPYYVCNYLKYDCELQKAQRVSQVLWFVIEAGTIESYKYKINYILILEEILEMLVKCLNEEDEYKLDYIISDERYEELLLEEKINLIFTVFFQDIEPNPYEEYFLKYPFKDKVVQEYVYYRVKTLKILSMEKLEELGMVKYIEKNLYKIEEE